MIVLGISVLLIGIVSSILTHRFVRTTTSSILQSKEQLMSYTVNKKTFAEEALRVATITAGIEKLEAYIQDPTETPELLSSFESLAKNSGVLFSINTVEAPRPEYKFITIHFSAKGSLQAITAFLEVLRQQQYQVDFTEFSLVRTESDVLSIAKNDKQTTTTQVMWEVRTAVRIPS